MLIVDQNKNTAMYLIHSLKVLCLMNNAMRTYYDLGTNLCLEEPINLSIIHTFTKFQKLRVLNNYLINALRHNQTEREVPFYVFCHFSQVFLQSLFLFSIIYILRFFFFL